MFIKQEMQEASRTSDLEQNKKGCFVGLLLASSSECYCGDNCDDDYNDDDYDGVVNYVWNT